MAKTIMIRTEDAVLKAEEIIKCANEERQRLNRMSYIVNSLIDVWHGQAQDTLVLRFDQFKREIENTIKATEAYADLLRTYAYNFADIENAAKKSFLTEGDMVVNVRPIDRMEADLNNWLKNENTDKG